VIVSFAIGNSDDKLTQVVWSQFVRNVTAMVEAVAAEGAQVHFAGYSAPAQPWQNAVWVLDLGSGADADALRGEIRCELAELCGKYGQDSIAWWEACEVDMIPPAQPAAVTE
jgi:hypothetical protein